MEPQDQECLIVYDLELSLWTISQVGAVCSDSGSAFSRYTVPSDQFKYNKQTTK